MDYTFMDPSWILHGRMNKNRRLDVACSYLVVFLMYLLWQGWVIFCKVFVTVGIVNRLDRVSAREVLCGCLAVCPVIGAGDHIEVTHLMDERASLRVGTDHWRSPERAA